MNFNLWSVLVAKEVHIGKLLKYPSASEFVCFSYFHGQNNSKIRVSPYSLLSPGLIGLKTPEFRGVSGFDFFFSSLILMKES